MAITLEPPSKDMLKEETSAGFYESSFWGKKYPRIQILTIEGLLNKTERLKAPPLVNPFAQPEIEGTGEKQVELI